MILDIDDLNNLPNLSHSLLMQCLKRRFQLNIIYTNTGCALVALNPFKDVDSLTALNYLEQRVNSTAKPHVFEVAQRALEKIFTSISSRECIIITGDSGAGKTVSAKLVLNYICTSNEHKKAALKSACSNTSGIEKKLLESNPLLEALGNAKTIHNKNSSRFGKFIELCFDNEKNLIGAKIKTYLLEKVRVTHQANGESNFHIFSQLLAVMVKENSARDLGLPSSVVNNLCTQYHVNVEKCLINWQKTFTAMSNVGLTDAQQVVQLLIVTLLLPLVSFCESMQEDKCELNTKQLESTACARTISQLLGIDLQRLSHTLTYRTIAAVRNRRQSIFHKPCSILEAHARKDCLSRLIYSTLFEHVAKSINEGIKPNDNFSGSTLGILDMYGFEVFQTNSLEQLCINYANEKLQQYYVGQVLRDQQLEYVDEAIGWTSCEYTDNRPCLDLLEGSPGIFALLSEECSLNRTPNDDALSSRISTTFERYQSFLAGKHSTCTFTINHYASSVTYSVEGMLEKNKDNVPSELLELLSTSNNAFIQHLFSSGEPQEAGKKKKTVLAKFKLSLDELMSILSTSECNYIRCIRPNRQRTPDLFDNDYVISQLKAAGIMEAIDVTRRGFASKYSYNDFLKQYAVILSASERKSARHCNEDSCMLMGSFKTPDTSFDDLDEQFLHQIDLTPRKRQLKSRRQHRRRTGLSSVEHSRKICASILKVVFENDNSIINKQFGKTKVFLSNEQATCLEDARKKALSEYASVIQLAWKRYLLKRSLSQNHLLRKLAAAIRGWALRQAVSRQTAAAVKIQKWYRWCHLQQAISNVSLQCKEDSVTAGSSYQDSNATVRSEDLSLLQKTINQANDTSVEMLLKHLDNVSMNDICHQQVNNSFTHLVHQKTAHDSVTTVAHQVLANDFSSVQTHTNSADCLSSVTDFMQQAVNTNTEQVACYLQRSTECVSLLKSLFIAHKNSKLWVSINEFINIPYLEALNGILSRRHLVQIPIRFHYKSTALKYGHIMPREVFQCSLSDIL